MELYLKCQIKKSFVITAVKILTIVYMSVTSVVMKFAIIALIYAVIVMKVSVTVVITIIKKLVNK